MSPMIFLLGVFFTDYITAEEIQHGNYFLNIDDGILRSINVTGDSVHIDLSGLKLQKIEENVFDSLSVVKTLNLSSNQLESLPPSIFSKLTQLETLSLADNKIDRLEEIIFIGLDKLKSLNISNNPFFHLPRGVFYGLPRSVDIIIKGSNDIYGLSTAIFLKPLPKPIIDEVAHENWDTHWIWDPPTGILPAVHANIQVKICKTSDGTLQSVEELKKDEAIGDCTKMDIYPRVHFIDLISLDLKKFQKGWYKLSAFPFNTIRLTQNNITEITPELLNDLPAGVTHVDLSHNKIEIIRKNVIENQHLEDLIISNAEISTIEESALAKTSLKELVLSSNRLKSLAFARTLPPTLQRLDVRGNAMAHIGEDSIKNLKNLIHINLVRNNITHFPVNTLRGLKELRRVDLAFNKLSEIHPGTFEDQEKIDTLELSHNHITHIDSGLFRGLKALKIIYFNNNKFQRISKDSFSNLKGKSEYSINFANNEIEIIEKGSFTGVAITWLDLMSNKISAIPEGAFDLPALGYLNLRNNSLVMIDGDWFAGTPNMSTLDLSENKIKSITKGAAKNLGSVQYLYLSVNPIERLENGALFGLSTQKEVTVNIHNTTIKVIQGGVFEDV